METVLSLNGGELKVPLISHADDEELGQSIEAAEAPSSSVSNKHSLGFGALVFLIYYNIGVPFGDEEVSPRQAAPMAIPNPLLNVGADVADCCSSY